MGRIYTPIYLDLQPGCSAVIQRKWEISYDSLKHKAQSQHQGLTRPCSCS